MARRLLVAVVAAVMAVPAVMTPAAADTSSWVHVPVPEDIRPQAALSEAVAFSADQGWAVGADAVGRQAPGYPLILRWNGGSWQRQALPAITWQGELHSVAGTAPDAVWAVGRDSAGTSRLLRYDGTSWSESRVPRGVVGLSKVVSGGGETWLIGAREGGPALLRWDGRAWRDLPVPPGAVYGLHIVAADDVWAAGSYNGAAVSHWDGRAWQQTVVDGTPRAAVGSILVVSPTEIWAGGTGGFIGGPPGRPIPPLLTRFDGQTWSRVALPADFGSITSLAPTDSGALDWVSMSNSMKWAPPGSYPPLEPGPDFLAWDGQAFTGHSEPAVAGEGDSSLLRLAAVPGSDTVWSVGRATGPESTFAPRILRFN
ncbi:hypothetical protein H9Y04_21860 [Streptomyces sp. TRM66268-LWL]|uniref:LigA protein n=1 Tax=Streptomyces polyasparticus TaxID=2767826 RepID=A0ABR7SI61_9ACTN|nr:hypothetical protein [Streptomyces polyasparticus]MBC9715201.1 hypothetical protein [Streptomyces polyasparticus]